jgi:mono/diheme cytochrome c family protein
MNPRPIATALLAVIALAGCGRHATHQGASTLTTRGGSVPSKLGASPSNGESVASRGGLFNDGRTVFVSTGCGACHTVASAHARGQIGPDFDTSEQLNRAQILTEIDAGANGMPSYQHTLTPREKRAIIEFIFQTMHTRH